MSRVTRYSADRFDRVATPCHRSKARDTTVPPLAVASAVAIRMRTAEHDPLTRSSEYRTHSVGIFDTAFSSSTSPPLSPVETTLAFTARSFACMQFRVAVRLAVLARWESARRKHRSLVEHHDRNFVVVSRWIGRERIASFGARRSDGARSTNSRRATWRASGSSLLAVAVQVTAHSPILNCRLVAVGRQIDRQVVLPRKQSFCHCRASG